MNRPTKLKPLGEVATLQRGFDLPKQDRLEGSIPIISSGGQSGFHNTHKVNPPGVVTGRYGSVGEFFYIKEKFWPLNTTLWVKDFHGNHEKYVYYLLSSLNFDKFSAKTGVPGVNRNDLHKIKVPFLPIQEQKLIVQVIEKWDSAIEKTEALISAKEKQFEWLTSNLMNKSNHDRCAASTCMTEVSTRNRSNNITRVLSVTNHSGFVLPEEQFERRVASSNVSNYKIVEKDQYAYNPSRINVGSIARLDDWDNGILSPMYVVFKIDEARVCSDYFLHWLNSSEARQRIKNSAQGSVRETVSFKDLGAIDIPLPAMNIQKDITHKLNTAQSEIALLKKTLEQYRLQKRGLMQKLLTGEWQVSTKEQTTEETRKEVSA